MNFDFKALLGVKGLRILFQGCSLENVVQLAPSRFNTSHILHIVLLVLNIGNLAELFATV